MNTKLFVLWGLCFHLLINLSAQNKDFHFDDSTPLKPWSDRGFENDPDNFQFAIVSDRTGGHRSGVFGKAVEKLNLLKPEFVMSVGDLIEGYTKDTSLLKEQWAEFDSLLNPLEMRFFYLPGNHDISNEVMRADWLKRYGRAYYHFVYKDVLFLSLDSNDGDDDATLSQEQIEYFKKAIEENPEVRWTMVFMHHPIWLYREFNGFTEIEDALANRPYTVLAGHYHRYMQALRKDRNYYVLASTGGGSRLRGPKFGEFDHVTWVTMSDDGPTMINLKLDGLLNHDVANETSRVQAQALIGASNFQSLMTANESKEAGEVYFGISNTSEDTIYFSGRVYHHHHLELSQSEWNLTVAPNSTAPLMAEWELSGDLPWERIDPIELDFTIGYRTEPLEPSFELEGSYTLPKVIKEDQIEFTDLDVFTDQHQIALVHDIPGLELRYTLDGSQPTLNANKYTGPFDITTTTTVKAGLFNTQNGHESGFLDKTYQKVKPLEPVKVRRKKPGLAYQYYEGNFEDLPDFSQLQATRSGSIGDLDVESLSGDDRIDHYAIQYEGYLEVPDDGLYTFYLYSDDGAKLYLHDQLVVDNGGSHSARLRKGYLPLKKGKHPLRIAYFEDFLGQTLQFYMSKPGQKEREPVSFDWLSH